MKTQHVGVSFGLLLAVSLPVAGFAQIRTQQVIARARDHNVCQTTIQERDAQGNLVETKQRYIHLQVAGNVWDEASKNYVPASSDIEVINGKGVARKANHKAIFSGDVADPAGTLDLELPTHQRVRERIAGIAFTDTRTGRSLFFSELQSAGGIVDASQVVYPNALGDGLGSVRYRFFNSGVERDVIFKTQFPDPSSPPFNMNPGDVDVEVWTEFLQCPTPKVDVMRTVRGAGGQGMERFAHRVSFGSMRFGPSQGFSVPQDANERMDIRTEWQVIRGRSFLIEAASYLDVFPLLAHLPKARVAFNREQNAMLAMAQLGRVTRSQPIRLVRDSAKTAQPQPPRQMALGTVPAQPGYVWDYYFAASADGFVFKGTETYYCDTYCFMSGDTVFQGGTVVKFDPNSSDPHLLLWDPPICDTSPHNMALFTARDDATIGSSVPGSTGSPTNFYGLGYILFYGPTTAVYVHDLRFLYARHGLGSKYTSYPVMLEGRNLQFVRCQFGPSLTSGMLTLGNALLDHCANGLRCYSGTTFANHVTIANCGNVVTTDGGGSGNFYLTNCLWANCTIFGTNYDSVTTNYCSGYAGTNGVFQRVGAGSYYLSDGSTNRNAGTTNIPAGLAQELARLTTSPPVILTNDWSTDSVLAPFVARDTAARDIGYHYPVLDYLIDQRTISNAALLLTNGVALGISGTNAFTLTNHAKLISEGNPKFLNMLTPYQKVQEQPGGLGVPAGLTMLNAPSSTNSEIWCRFTQMSSTPGLSDPRWLFYASGSNTSVVRVLSLADCEIYGLQVAVSPTTGSISVCWTNNLFSDGQLLMAHTAGNDLAFYARNNHFRGVDLRLSYTTNGSLNRGWEVRDNLFESAYTWVDGWYSGVTNSHNGYYNTSVLGWSLGSDVTVSAVDYEAGPLGRFYYPRSGGNLSSLINAGSRNATNAGLYHYTSSASGPKETNSTVDIGRLYCAVSEGPGRTYIASKAFSATQGAGNWRYQYSTEVQGDTFADMDAYDNSYADNPYWYYTGDTSAIGRTWLQPGDLTDAVRMFVSPTNGAVRILSPLQVYGQPRLRILKNSSAVQNWLTLTNSWTGLSHAFSTSAGDELRFQLSSYGSGWTLGTWNPTIQFDPDNATVLWDSDGDGVPDYFEDRNGNGAVESGETDWQSASDLGLKLRISQPKANSNIP